MKNLKKMFTVMAIVAVALFSALTVSAQGNGTTYKYHSLLKPQYNDVLSGSQVAEILADLFRYESKSREESYFQLGDDFARDIYTRILNKDFGINGQPLTNEEMADIILSAKVVCMPADYASNSKYAGRVERYTSDGTVSSWTRDVTSGEQWLVYKGKPFGLVRCGNGFDLTTQDNWKGAPATQSAVAGNTPNIVIYNRNIIQSPRPQSVMYRAPVDQRDVAAANRNTGIPTYVKVGVVIIIVAVVADVLIQKAAAAKKAKDNAHSNQWIQDGGSSPFPPGSGSGTPNGPTI